MSCSCGQNNELNNSGGNGSNDPQSLSADFLRTLQGKGKLGVFEAVQMVAALITIFYFAKKLANE